jgi:hypothetical protein
VSGEKITEESNRSGLISRLSRFSERLPLVPSRVSSELVARRGLERRFGLIAAPLEEPTDEALAQAVVPAAQAIAGSDIVDELTVIELRPVVSEDDICTGLVGRSTRAMEPAKDILRKECEVMVVPNPVPIVLTKHQNSPVNTEHVWATLDEQYEHLRRQFAAETGQRHNTALVTMAEPDYAARIFAPQLLFGRRVFEEHQPVILAPLGEEQRDLVLAPPLTG